MALNPAASFHIYQMEINKIINGWAVKLVLIATLVNYALIAYVQGSLPEIQPYLIGLVVMTVVAAYLQMKAKMPNLLTAAGVGVIGYGSYSLLMTFTTLNTDPFLLADEAIRALSFGALTLIIYYIGGLVRK